MLSCSGGGGKAAFIGVGGLGQSADSYCWLCNYSKYSKQIMAGLQNIKIYFFKTLEIQMFLRLTKIFLDSQQNFTKVCKKLDFCLNNGHY